MELNSDIDLFNYVEPTGGTISSIDYEAIWRAISSLSPVQLRSAPDPNYFKRSLAPSPNAQLLLKARSEQGAIADARKMLTKATSKLEHEQKSSWSNWQRRRMRM